MNLWRSSLEQYKQLLNCNNMVKIVGILKMLLGYMRNFS